MTIPRPIWFILSASLILTLFCFLAPRVLSAQANTDEETQAKHWRAAIQAARIQDFRSAVSKADAASKAGLTQPLLFYHRGRWNFRIGQINDSLRDFDRFVKEVPDRANSQWERGITCYYANKFKAGSKQFEDYQKFQDNDVENAVWRYLCQMKFDGKEKARAAILPIKNDTRIPMMEIYRLFRGESNPEKVLKALESAKSSGERKRQQTFDAHLYLALFFDSEDHVNQAAKHVDLAVRQFEKGGYMWAVAVAHKNHLQQRIAKRKRADSAE